MKAISNKKRKPGYILAGLYAHESLKMTASPRHFFFFFESADHVLAITLTSNDSRAI